ncbi:unnamed protein product [Gongylonema pulchrum]|uniref:Uncharacterized protein n=1 Tax=Gongylonema pulchrum TaxID=637853 RepID=A0A3P7M7D9_9BILA|nr:unnamed protein product [Gongylonema pulchrum]
MFDSLTNYFGPSEGRRRRQRTKTYEEEQNEKVQMEMIAQMVKAESSAKEDSREEPVQTEHRPNHAGTSGETPPVAVDTDNQKSKFFEGGHKRGKKRALEKTPEQPERPPTPTEIIQQREQEWRERQRKRREKHKRRQNELSECWNNDVMAEKESYQKFTSMIEQIFENIDDFDVLASGNADSEGLVTQDVLIDKGQLQELREEAQKLKSWNIIHKVNSEHLVTLLTILEKNVRDVIGADGEQSIIPLFNEDDEDDSSETYRELISDRILRAANASCTAMLIMTSTRMPKQVSLKYAYKLN